MEMREFMIRHIMDRLKQYGIKVERTENVQSFTVDPVADFSREIRGKATSGMMIYAYSNGKKIGQAQVVDGKYFMSIPKQAALF